MVAERKPNLSPSRLSTYLACSSRYRWTYLDRRGRFYLRARSYFSFGTSLHRVLERFHDCEDHGVETVAQAIAALEESWIESGYSSQQEMSEALGEGVAIVEAYTRRQLERSDQAETVFVERRLTKEYDSFVLLGQVDRLDRHEDGRLEIVDYKSGRAEPTEEDVAVDLAMNVYQLLVREHYPGVPVTSTLMALRTLKSASATPSDSELAEFENDLVFVAGELLNREWEYVVPTYKPLCRCCEFLPLCRKYEDFSEPSPEEG